MTTTESRAEQENPLKNKLDFDSTDDDEPELGSAAMYEAIFKKKPALSSKDMAKAREEAVKYLKKSGTETRNRIPKKKRKVEKDKIETKVVKEDDTDEMNLSQETRDLMNSVKDLLRDEEELSDSPEECDINYPSTEIHEESWTNKQDEEEEAEKVASETIRRHGKLILCQVVLQGKKYPLKIFENQTVAELREQIIKKTGVADEWLDLYYGDFTVLDDRKKVKDYGIKCLEDIDAFVLNKNEKEIYMAGSDSIMRFSLQTDDRRGRSKSFVYVKKSSTMRDAVVKYCEQFGLDSSKVKLKFDGDLISLNATPEECDLEGDECIDVIVTE